MNRKKKKAVRILAVILAVLLAGSAIVSVVVSMAGSANAEANVPSKNQFDIQIKYMENEQALRISQRIVYTNQTSQVLDRVVFYVPANIFRRESALMYENDVINDVFPYGFYPGGCDIVNVSVDGKTANWGYQGTNEIYLRVECSLEPGESCSFAFDYFLLITQNKAFLGVDDLDVRLSDFIMIPASIDALYGEAVLNSPLSFTEYIDTTPGIYDIEITLPGSYLLASSCVEETIENTDDTVSWKLHGENIRDLSVSFGKRYRQDTAVTSSGIRIRCLTNTRGRSQTVLKAAEAAIEFCENYFDTFPYSQLDIVESGYALEYSNSSGCIWLSSELLKDTDRMKRIIYFCIAQQYFGKTAYASPVSDAWLSGSVCSYISYLVIEETEGHEAYLKRLNKDVLPSLQLTIPGGLNITSSASLFNSYEYSIVIFDRGAAVFHELCTSMGRDELLLGLKLFYRKGKEKEVLTEMDLVNSFDEASGKSWESFLTDWVFNIGDYVEQHIDWLD